VPLARASNARYFIVRVEPGEHAFRANDQQASIEMDLKLNQEYFLRVEIAVGFMENYGRLVAVAPEQAKYELRTSNLMPLDAKNVIDRARVSTDQIPFTEAESLSAAIRSWFQTALSH
jgi:hypothetical protein